uniref:Uncharacterized protein n=1 Tax=Anguilla anguilla TaxID=7936 RepID=A0A0E9SD33_ANGAN
MSKLAPFRHKLALGQ